MYTLYVEQAQNKRNKTYNNSSANTLCCNDKWVRVENDVEFITADILQKTMRGET